VPLKVYFTKGHAKLLVGVGKGRKKGDKRQAIADREMRRDIDREMGRRR
jgi:SsrA-binding protein